MCMWSLQGFSLPQFTFIKCILVYSEYIWCSSVIDDAIPSVSSSVLSKPGVIRREHWRFKYLQHGNIVVMAPNTLLSWHQTNHCHGTKHIVVMAPNTSLSWHQTHCCHGTKQIIVMAPNKSLSWHQTNHCHGTKHIVVIAPNTSLSWHQTHRCHGTKQIIVMAPNTSLSWHQTHHCHGTKHIVMAPNTLSWHQTHHCHGTKHIVGTYFIDPLVYLHFVLWCVLCFEGTEWQELHTACWNKKVKFLGHFLQLLSITVCQYKNEIWVWQIGSTLTNWTSFKFHTGWKRTLKYSGNTHHISSITHNSRCPYMVSQDLPMPESSDAI